MRPAATGRGSRAGAFTLIELLVVVAIVALLISILLPTLKAAKDKARFVKCASHLRAQISATRLYADENRDYLPFSNWILWQGHREVPLPGWLYTHRSRNFDRKLQRRLAGKDKALLWPYLKDDQLYRCPKHVIDPQYPNAGRYSWMLTSYLMNGAVNAFPWTYADARFYRIERFRNDAVIFWEPPWLEAIEGVDFDETGLNTWNDGSSYPTEWFTQRHGGASTVAHIDGHCDTYDVAKWRKQIEFGPSPLWCAPNDEFGGGPHPQ